MTLQSQILTLNEYNIGKRNGIVNGKLRGREGGMIGKSEK
jgi:hypothetical protein